MTTRIGFDAYTIGHRNLSASATLAFARSHGLDGIQFLDPSVIDPKLRRERLSAFRKQANELGLFLEIGIPSPNPVRRARELDRAVTPTEHAQFLAPHLDAVAALGCRHARAYVGDRHDRFRTDVRWPEQINQAIAVLELLTPRLRELELKVAIENHADLTADELLGLLDRLDSEVAGVTLDTGNLVMRLDDPIRAAARLAPRVLSTHVKDCVLAFTPRGLAWQARPVGSGILPMPDLLAPVIVANSRVNLSIELHPRTYDLPINDPTWLSFFPGLKSSSLAAVVELARRCAANYADGTFAPPDHVEAVDWPDRDLEWLALSLGYLRSVVPALARLDPRPHSSTSARSTRGPAA
jgi:sugar phosphate isomerase/epimerase